MAAAPDTDDDEGRPKSSEEESGFSQPEMDSSESMSGCTLRAMEETRARPHTDSLCSGKPARAHTEPLADPMHGNAKSTHHTAPHPVRQQLEPYEPTHHSPEDTTTGSPAAEDPASGPSGACGGNPDNQNITDPSAPSSDDIAESNNQVSSPAMDDGGKADEEMSKSMTALEVEAKIKMSDDDVEFSYKIKGDPADVRQQTQTYMNLVEKARYERRRSSSSASSSQKDGNPPINKNIPPIFDKDTKQNEK